MTPSELTMRVTARSALLVAGLAVVAALLGGLSAACGVLAGGAVGVGNFRWLAASALSASTAPGRTSGVRWLGGAVLRFAALLIAAGAVLVSGWAHPVAVVGGLTVVPCALIAAGLRGGRHQEARG